MVGVLSRDGFQVLPGLLAPEEISAIRHASKTASTESLA